MPDERQAAGAGASTSPQCVWHFVNPSDTSDSDQTPNVSHCDADSFDLADGILDVSVQRCGTALVGGEEVQMRVIGAGATSWCTDLTVNGSEGLICVNRLPAQ